jgi:hypothetical protein
MTRKRVARPPLPPACSHCRPYGGAWRNYGTADRPQLARCDCARGKALGMGAKWGGKAKTHDGRQAGAGL